MYYVYRFRNQPENTDCHNLLIYQDDERCYEQKDPVCINLFVPKYKPFIWIVETRSRKYRENRSNLKTTVSMCLFVSYWGLVHLTSSKSSPLDSVVVKTKRLFSSRGGFQINAMHPRECTSTEKQFNQINTP